ncbi:uncharacterized protein LOC121733948 [Aricia agestis]|uniref:uncharacterized protein LOC121733948 n=1 Tax=Aricia agestis TaxID=91739 RepID=UPI001C204089|nr:uncharacterized protein LOC121733948 [Aricia agestis]
MFGRVTFLFLALFAFQGLCVTEVWLDERNVDYIQSDLLGVSFSIAKWWFDTLEECHIIVPDGSRYEAYPNSNLPSHIFFMEAVQPFTSCSVGMRGVGVEHSGTYELLSLVRHSADNSQTLTRQKNNLTIRTVDLFPTSDS